MIFWSRTAGRRKRLSSLHLRKPCATRLEALPTIHGKLARRLDSVGGLAKLSPASEGNHEAVARSPDGDLAAPSLQSKDSWKVRENVRPGKRRPAVALQAGQGRICTEGVTAFEAGIFEDHDKTLGTVLVLSPKLKVDFACSVAGVSPPVAAGRRKVRMQVHTERHSLTGQCRKTLVFLTGQLSII